MKTFKRALLAVLLAILMALCLPGVVLAEEVDDIQINVSQDDLLDIVLTLGDTDSELSTFSDDLTAALVAKGVPEDRINITAVEASEVSAGNTSSGWLTYDHITTGWNFTDYSYSAVPAPTGNTGSPYKHIWVYNEGQQIIFYGYDSPAYKDFMFMPNDDSTEKTFTFTMNDANINNHSMLGGGFIFNANISGADYAQVADWSTLSEEQSIVTSSCLSGQTISGYALLLIKSGTGSYPALYKFTNVNMNSFVSGNNMTLVASDTSHLLSGVHNITIKVSGDTFEMTDTVGSTTYTFSYTGLVDTGSYGFGPMAQYISHGCSRLSWFNFENLHMETTSARRFSEVIREPEWRDGSKRFIINAEDGAVSDFSDSTALGEILSRLGNEGISYIGWGKDAEDGNAFITKNSGNGTYVDKTVTTTDTYAEQVAAMADYIYSQYYDSVTNDTEYLLYGRQNVMSVTPESAQTNTADEEWPNGKWLVDQDPNYYNNPTGTVPYDELYLSNLDISFTETGRYQIYYKDVLVKTVYVHRKPVAGFTASIDASYNITITDNAYDPDYQNADDKGIASVTWRYKKTTDSEWISGMPTTLEAGCDYIIMQMVTDSYGVASTPYYRYVTTASGVTSTPVAEFTVTPSTLLTYVSSTVSYSDTSYDPAGAAITSRTWTITKEGATTPIYTGAEPMTDFSGVEAGTYKITLSVTNANNVESEEVARFLTVVRDTTAPTAACDTMSGTYNSEQTVNLTFSDEAGGSGFSYRYAVVTSTATTPTEWGSMGTNASYSVLIDSPGVKYVHYKVYDNAGNVQTGYFGPFTLVDNTAPSAPTIETDPAYTDGTWVSGGMTLTASGATDDFTASDKLAYTVKLDSGSFSEGKSIALDADSTGVYTVTFRVTDESGNYNEASKTVKLDNTAPNAPGLAMISNEAAYTAGTWATKAVSISLSGSSDADSGLSGYQYKIDGGSWTSGSSYVFNTSGEYTLYYRSVDAVGNTSAENSAMVKVDLEAPGEPQISYSPDYTSEWTNKTTTVSAQLATDNLTDTEDIVYECSTNGTTFEAGSSIELSGEGVHTVYFRVTDAAGISTTVSRTVKIDKTDPGTPDINMISGGDVYTEDTWTPSAVAVTLSGGADTGGSGLAGYQYKVDDGDWQNGAIFTLDASGEYTVRYRGVDNAGNISGAGEKTVKVDLEAPETFSINTTITTIDSIDIQAQTTDALSGVVAYRVFDGTDWSEWKDSVDETLTGYTRAQEVTLQVEAKDAAGNVCTAEVTVQTLLNTAPAAEADEYTMREDAARLTLTLLDNDTDADAGDVLTVSQVSALSTPSAGTLTLTAGVVTFKPAADWNGTVTFTYTAKDTYDAVSVGNVTLTVTPVNDGPVANDDHVSTQEDTTATFAVARNDVDVDSAISIASFTQPSHGAVVKSGSSLKYTPEPDYNGADSFTYTVTDGMYESTATVYVTVESVNDVPFIIADTGETRYGQPVTIDALINDSDIDGDTLTLVSVTVPQHGSARISDGKIVYTPAGGFTGTDTFSYTATDGAAEGTAQVTVTVSYPESMTSSSTIFSAQDLSGGTGGSSGGNTGGDTGDSSGGSTGGDTGDSSGGSTGGDTGDSSGGDTGDGDDDPTLQVQQQPGHGTLTEENGTVVYTPDEGTSGVDTFRVTLNQGGVDVEYLVATNTDPVTGETTTLGYGLPLGSGNFSVTSDGQVTLDLSQYVDGDLDNAVITVNGQPVNGTVEIVDGQLVYTPAEGFTGTDAVVLTISINGEEVPYALSFSVDEHQPLAALYAIIGVIAAGLLIWLLLAWRSIVPIAEAVTNNGDGTMTIQWGYKNRKGKKEIDAKDSQLTVLAGSVVQSSMTPPNDFEKGRVENVFTTIASAGSKIQWKIKNRKASVDLSKMNEK